MYTIFGNAVWISTIISFISVVEGHFITFTLQSCSKNDQTISCDKEHVIIIVKVVCQNKAIKSKEMSEVFGLYQRACMAQTACLVGDVYTCIEYKTICNSFNITYTCVEGKVIF